MARKVALPALLLIGLLYYYFYAGGSAPAGQPPLQRLTAQNLATIRDQFNAASGDVRVLLLLSPT